MLLENYTHVISDLSPMILVLNLLFFYLLYGFAAFLSGSVRRGFQIATLVPMLFGLTNYFVVNFRGSPIVPWDLLSLGTAVSVADNYTFTLSWKAAASVLMFIWMILIVSKSSVTFRNWKIRFAVAAVWLIGLGGYISGIQKNSVQSFFGMDTTLFTLNVLYRNNGIAAAFLGNLRFLNIEEPSGYSAKKARRLRTKYMPRTRRTLMYSKAKTFRTLMKRSPENLISKQMRNRSILSIPRPLIHQIPARRRTPAQVQLPPSPTRTSL